MKRISVSIVALSMLQTAPLRADDDVEIRAFVNNACVVADEPFFLPDEGDQKARALPLVGLIIGKLTELLLGHAVNTAADRISSKAERKDTRYAVTRQMNLFRAELDPAPDLHMNGDIGCMTIVASKFQPPSTGCTSAYQPRAISIETVNKPRADWVSSRTDNSLENKLRRANICTVGEPRAVFESRFEFSEDGTAYRLKNAGYSMPSLLSTTDKKAVRNVFYTLEIAQPGATDKRESLSMALINLGKVSAGAQAVDPDDSAAPWLRAPTMSVEARRNYEQHTKLHQEIAAEIEALQRALVRNEKVQSSLEQRLPGSRAEMLKELKQQIAKNQVQHVTLEAELEARKAEYADLPKGPQEFMPVSIEVGITETASEKRALMAMAKIIQNTSGMLASVVGGATSDRVNRSIDLESSVESDKGRELEAARAEYFDALIASREKDTSVDSQQADLPAGGNLASAKTRYNAARQALGLEAIE